MKKHLYEIITRWKRAKETSFEYPDYSRNHTIQTEGRPLILSSSDKAFNGDPSRYNPEELFISSISSCHMLWYLHLCATNKISVVDYLDRAEGTMVEESSGSGRFSEVLLNPVVKITESNKKELAVKLHQEANRFCFIANSCNFEIKHNPTIDIL